MPTVLRIGPYRFFFYSGDREEPRHKSSGKRTVARFGRGRNRSGYTVGAPTLRPEEGDVEAKEAVRALLDRLPDDCSVEDVLYHLYVLQAVERGQADAAAGRTIPHEEVENALRRKWLAGGEA